MVAHAQRQNGLVHPHMVSDKHKVRGFLVCRLDDEIFVVEGDVPDLRPGEANLRCQPVGEEVD